MTLLQSILPSFVRENPAHAQPLVGSNESRVKPIFTLRENGDAFKAVVQLPGVAKEGLEITVQEGEITVVGRRSWTPPAEWTTLYRETSRAPYELVLSYGSEVDADKISAELKDGLLALTLPKAEVVKPRKIAVN